MRAVRLWLALSLVLPNTGCSRMCRNMWRRPLGPSSAAPGANRIPAYRTAYGRRKHLALANVDPAEARVGRLLRRAAEAPGRPRPIARASRRPSVDKGLALQQYLSPRLFIGPPIRILREALQPAIIENPRHPLAPASLQGEGSGWGGKGQACDRCKPFGLVLP